MKFKRVLSGVVLSAICVSMTGCKGSVDTSDPFYRLVGKLFDDDLPWYMDATVSEVNKDFDDLLEEDSEMYDKYIKSEKHHDEKIYYKLKTDDINIFGGILSFPDSCYIWNAELSTSVSEKEEEYIHSFLYTISIEKYVEEKNMDKSDKIEFLNDIRNQFTEAIVCDYEEKIYLDGVYVQLKTDFSTVKFELSDKSNFIMISIY